MALQDQSLLTAGYFIDADGRVLSEELRAVGEVHSHDGEPAAVRAVLQDEHIGRLGLKRADRLTGGRLADGNGVGGAAEGEVLAVGAEGHAGATGEGVKFLSRGRIPQVDRRFSADRQTLQSLPLE